MPDDFELERPYDHHAQALFAFLLNLTRQPEDTRDLLQDLFLSGGTLGHPTMGVFTGNNGSPILVSTALLPTNQWVHLAATLSGTTGTIYINGQPTGSGTLNSAPNVIRTNNYLGRSNYSADQYANAMFDEIRLWNVARTPAQLLSTLHLSLPATTPGLVGLWRFDEGAGPTTAEAISQVPSYLSGGATWTNSGAPFIPYASVLAPTAVQGATATFNGSVNPGNLATAAWFEWGTTTNYGNTTALASFPATNGALPLSLLVTNFNPAMVCHYAVVATNAAGTNVSADVAFLSAPVVTTLADDSSPGSLRNVIANLSSGATVTFATNGTITLTNGEIALTNDLTLAGPGPANLSISGKRQSRQPRLQRFSRSPGQSFRAHPHQRDGDGWFGRQWRWHLQCRQPELEQLCHHWLRRDDWGRGAARICGGRGPGRGHGRRWWRHLQRGDAFAHHLHPLRQQRRHRRGRSARGPD